MIKSKERDFLIKIVLGTVFILSCFTIRVNAQFSKNTLKAAYIERITRFVDWPLRDSPHSKDRFIMGVFGDIEFFNILTDVYKEKSIKGYKVTVIQIYTPEQLDNCNLCYLSEKDELTTEKFVNEANLYGVLLISESKNFCKEGGHINFYQEDEMLKFEMNEKSIVSAGFKVSYLLLQNTRIVK